MPLKLFLPGLLILAIFCVGCDESDDAGEILGTRNWTSTADGVPKVVFNAGEDIQFCVAFKNYSDIIPRTYNPHPEDGMIPPGGSLEILSSNQLRQTSCGHTLTVENFHSGAAGNL